MERFVLERTGKVAVAFLGERLLFETEDVACSNFEFHGYISYAPIECYVLAVKERRFCGDICDVFVFDDREHYEKAVIAGSGTLALFRIAHAVKPRVQSPECASCPRGGI